MFSRNSKRTSHSGGGGFLGKKNHEDPSIGAARERVHAAEEAERQADRALVSARRAVQEAREHVKHLEREAAEEARLATIKQHQAADIGRSAKGLGRELKYFLVERKTLTVHRSWVRDRIASCGSLRRGCRWTMTSGACGIVAHLRHFVRCPGSGGTGPPCLCEAVMNGSMRSPID